MGCTCSGGSRDEEEIIRQSGQDLITYIKSPQSKTGEQQVSASSSPEHPMVTTDEIVRRRILENLPQAPELRKAAIDYLNSKNESPVHEAAARGRIAALKVLLQEFRGDPNIQTRAPPKGRFLAPLHRAASHGRPDVIELLHKCGAVLDPREKPDGTTPLHAAANHNRTECIKMLCTVENTPYRSRRRKESHDDVSQQNLETDETPDSAAAGSMEGCSSSFRGCGIDVKDKEDSKTALHVAAGRGYRESVEVLLSFGADINAQTNEDEQQTPLHYAVRYYHVVYNRRHMSDHAGEDSALSKAEDLIVYLIVEANADCTIKDATGKTARDLAVSIAPSASRAGSPAPSRRQSHVAGGVLSFSGNSSILHWDDNVSMKLGFIFDNAIRKRVMNTLGVQPPAGAMLNVPGLDAAAGGSYSPSKQASSRRTSHAALSSMNLSVRSQGSDEEVVEHEQEGARPLDGDTDAPVADRNSSSTATVEAPVTIVVQTSSSSTDGPAGSSSIQ